MRVITRNKLGIDTLQKLNSRLIIRVLRNKFSVNGQVENFGLGMFNGLLQIVYFNIKPINNH